jgi:hypothetical protein
MENERLLSDERLNGLVAQCGFRITLNDAILVAIAQDVKSIAALIEWLDETCDKHQDKEKCDPEYFPLKRNCSTCWQELKESVK